jgi:HK97 family phage major capsid protein
MSEEEKMMGKIMELREKRARVWEQAKTFLDERRGEDDLLSAEDALTYEKMEIEVVNLGKEIERLERQAALDLELSQATSTVLKSRPGVEREKEGRASNEYREAFWRHMRNRSDLEVRNSLTVGTDSEGGYLVPDEFERTLIEALEAENIMRQLAKVITTSSGDKKIPVVASKGMATWVEEEGPILEDDDTFTQVSIGAYKVATMIKVSEELLNDSVFDLEGYIAKEFGRRIGAKEEEAFLVGNGQGKPTGIFDADHGGQIGVTTAAASIKMDEIFDLFYSLKSPYRKRAVFITNDTTVKEIRKLKDGQGQYLWQPSLKVGEVDTILNCPVKTSVYVPSVAPGEKVIAFGDFSYYWIADRQDRSFQRLSELYAATGQVGFRTTQRVDGRLILQEAIKILQMKG